MCLLITIYWISEHNHLKNIEQLFLLLCLVFTNPGWCAKLVGPRSYNLTARVFGEITVLLFILSLLYFPVFDMESIFYISILISIILLSSQFALQYVLILLPFLSIINLNLNYLYILIGGFFISTFITHGQFLRNLSGKYYHLKKYITHHLKVHSQFKKKEVNLILRLKNSMFGKSLYNLPVVILFLFMLIKSGNYNTLNHQIILVTILIYLVTSFGIFRAIGEGVRYLDFITFPCYYLIISELDSYVIYFLILIQTIFFLLNIIKSLKHKAISKYNYLRGLVNFRKFNRINPSVVLPYTSSTPWFLWYFTSAKIVFTLCHSDKYWTNRNYSDYYSDYPNLSKAKIKLLLEEFNVDCILVSKIFVNKFADLTKGYKIFHSSNTFTIYIKEKC